ncbi:MAG: DUF5011 domain-containing protein [Lachnospiraceae bacterium]|nr:DUF5011 domain-containing protein [Lachnospiraceae bacterium]
MKKQIAILLTASLCLTALVGCGSNDNEENTAPQITGVQDTATTQAGTEFNALSGVTASDKEDGDVTANITVESVPALTFTNGKATPTAPGSYELIYTVKDSGNLEANAWCTLTVTPAIGQEEELYNFEFTEGTQADDKGWTATIGGDAQGTAAVKQGSYVLDITNSGSGDDQVRLVKNVTLSPAEYEIKFWMKSSVKTYAHFIAEDASTDEWKDFGGIWNAEVGTAVAPLTAKFTLTEEKSVDLRLHLGKITPNGDNPSDTSAQAFVASIDKVELIKTTGTETEDVLYTQDFAQSAESVTGNFWDNSAGEITLFEGAAKVEITAARTEGGVWSSHFFVALGDNTLEEGKKYSYSVEVTAKESQEVEFFLVTNGGDSNKVDGDDAGFSYGLNLPAGEKKTLTGTFTAPFDVTSPALRFQIGGKDAGQLNEFIVDNVKLSEMKGDKIVSTTTDTFITEGTSDNPFATYNEGGGLGSVYTEEGKLVYRIEKFGSADWHNKLVFGYGDNPLELPYGALFTITVKVKATKALSCDLHLHEIDGNWDTTRPITGSLDITTEEKTFTFTAEESLLTEGNYELLFQNFVPKDGNKDEGVTIEITALSITQRAYI